MRRKRIWVAQMVFLALSGQSGVGFAQKEAASKPIEPKGYVCYRASAPIVIDGRLDEATWAAAPWTDAFVDIEGDAKPKPHFRTRAKMLWDAHYFYIAAELEEPHVWGTLTQHDAVIFQDNDFEVFLDPDGDNHQYYELEINALDTEWDLRLVKPYRDGGPALNAWEIPGLKTGVHVQGTLNDAKDSDKGWTVELALPWEALAEFANRPTPPRDGDQWRINFSRVEWRHEVAAGRYVKPAGIKEDNWVWSPQGVIDMHRPEMWGYVQFSMAESGHAAFRPDPTGPIRRDLMRVYAAQRTYHEANKRWASSLHKLGLDHALKAGPIEMKPTSEGYEAWSECRDATGKPQRVTVRQDSRIRVTPNTP
jgi:hypothetical protein